MSRRFLRYLDRHFGLREQVGELTDTRAEPDIPLQAVWLTVFLLFVGRWKSLHAMETDLHRHPRPLSKVIGKHPPSARSIGRVMDKHLSADELRQMHIGNLKRLRRMKSLHQRPGCRYRVGAVDCHEQFATRHLCCPACLRRWLIVNGEMVLEYYHRYVFFELVGIEPRVMVDVEPVRSAEDEVAAADRLAARVFSHYPHLCQVVVADAAYQEAPFFRKLRAMGKHVVATLKDERRDIFVDAASLQRSACPLEVVEEEKFQRGKLIRRTTLKVYDLPELQTWPQLGMKARVVYCQVTTVGQHRRGNRLVMETEIHHWWWVTDLTVGQASVMEIVRMGRWRWHIENTFNEMVQHWGLDHRFKHTPNALVNFLLMLFIAHLLESTFYLRGLQPEARVHLTCVALGDELRRDLTGEKPKTGCDPP